MANPIETEAWKRSKRLQADLTPQEMEMHAVLEQGKAEHDISNGRDRTGRQSTEGRETQGRKVIQNGLWQKKYTPQIPSKNAAFQPDPSLFAHGVPKTLCLGTKKFTFQVVPAMWKETISKRVTSAIPPGTTAAFYSHQTRAVELVVALRSYHHMDCL